MLLQGFGFDNIKNPLVHVFDLKPAFFSPLLSQRTLSFFSRLLFFRTPGCSPSSPGNRGNLFARAITHCIFEVLRPTSVVGFFFSSPSPLSEGPYPILLLHHLPLAVLS